VTQQDHSATKKSSNFSLGIGVLLACSFGIATSNSIIFGALSDLQDKYNFSDSGLGFISAAGFLASLIVQLVVAPLADRGHPKRLVMTGLVIAMCGSALFAIGGSLGVLIIARALTGASMGCTQPAIRAIAAHLDPSQAAERLGRLRGVELAGFTGGPLIGALLIEPFGLRVTFFVFTAFAAVVLLMMAPRQLPTLPKTETSNKPSLELLRYRAVRASALASLTLFLPVGIYDSLWDRYITDRGGNNFMVGLSFLVYTLPFIAFGARGGRLSDTHGSQRMVLIGIAMCAPIVFVYGLLTQSWAIVLMGGVEGIVGAFAIPAAQSLMATAAPPGRASAAQGILGAGDLLAATLVSLIAPTIYGRYGAMTTFGSAAIAMCVLCVLIALMLRGARTESGLSSDAQ